MPRSCGTPSPDQDGDLFRKKYVDAATHAEHVRLRSRALQDSTPLPGELCEQIALFASDAILVATPQLDFDRLPSGQARYILWSGSMTTVEDDWSWFGNLSVGGERDLTLILWTQFEDGMLHPEYACGHKFCGSLLDQVLIPAFNLLADDELRTIVVTPMHISAECQSEINQ